MSDSTTEDQANPKREDFRKERLNSSFLLNPKDKETGSVEPAYKIEVVIDWMQKEWRDKLGSNTTTAITTFYIAQSDIVDDTSFKFSKNGWSFTGRTPVDCPVLWKIAYVNPTGAKEVDAGAYLYHFTHDSGEALDILVTVFFTDSQGDFALALVPNKIMKVWKEFEITSHNLAYNKGLAGYMIVIGGEQRNLQPTVSWDEIILEQSLKDQILGDVRTFFEKGVSIYRKLNLKPFRKLLLSGSPGTGKSMICNAIAKWGIDKGYSVVYVSGAIKGMADRHGAEAWKLRQAITTASTNLFPTIIIIEEIDAFLNTKEKASILNILDGAETPENDKGILLISTTNYPEIINEGAFKRPGRIDRIYEIPVVKSAEMGQAMLRRYLGDYWRDEFIPFASGLVNYSGAFIRELVIHAMTQAASIDSDIVSSELLDVSLKNLLEYSEEQSALRQAVLDYPEDEDEEVEEPQSGGPRAVKDPVNWRGPKQHRV